MHRWWWSVVCTGQSQKVLLMSLILVTGPPSKLHYRVHCIIDSGVVEREVLHIDPIIDAAPWG